MNKNVALTILKTIEKECDSKIKCEGCAFYIKSTKSCVFECGHSGNCFSEFLEEDMEEQK